MTTHRVKVDTAYVDALLSGIKTFEVRRNDRGYQVGDYLLMQEVGATGHENRYGQDDGHWVEPGAKDCSLCRERRYVRARITYVYSGDPRFDGIEPGHVVLALDGVGLSLPIGGASSSARPVPPGPPDPPPPPPGRPVA